MKDAIYFHLVQFYISVWCGRRPLIKIALDPEMRNASDTEADFRKHVFFSQMDWNQIEARSIDAPIITTTRDRKTRDAIEMHIDNIC